METLEASHEHTRQNKDKEQTTMVTLKGIHTLTKTQKKRAKPRQQQTLKASVDMLGIGFTQWTGIGIVSSFLILLGKLLDTSILCHDFAAGLHCFHSLHRSLHGSYS